MAQDVRQTVLRTFMGLLATLALSLEMSIGEKGDTVIFTPPPPGSRDSPIPPEDFLTGSGVSPLDSNHPPGYNNNLGSDPQSRGGNSISYYDDQMPPMPDGYISLPGRSFPLVLPDPNVTSPLPTTYAPPGSLFPCDCNLCKGCSKGQKGDRGDRGLPGQPGSLGSRGLTGAQGPPGFRGPPGIKGQKGDDGTKGDQGLVGIMGPKGERGFKGDKGDIGLNGSPGVQGPPGEPGLCPASCESTRGTPGEVGLPGIVGPRGLPGEAGVTGTKGQRGDKGEVGVPGLQGLGGQKGDQGDQGLCNCTDGAKGATGNQGSKGEKGNIGQQGPAGVGGLKGDKGDLGMNGSPGPCSPAIQSAFSARLGDIYPLPNLPVPFTEVLYNMMFHFNPKTGTYRAPVNGTYVFSYYLVVLSKALRVGFFLNFKPIVKSTELTSLSTISQQVVLHLNMGDEVWLQVKDTDSNGMYASGETSSTFSGFLLYPDSCDLPLSRDMPDPIVGTYTWGDL